VGEEFFRAMARVFVAAHPPRSPLMMRYGDEFPDFAAGFAPAAEIAYLADVARIEAGRTRAYHAADATPLDAAAFAGIRDDALGATRFLLHPSVEIVRSPHPAVTLWAMNAGDLELAPIDNWRAEDALIARPGLDVEVRVLPAGAAFLVALKAGTPLGAATEAAAAENPDFDLTANLAGIIRSGLVVGLSNEKDRNP
jgi:hypothetical protein